MKKLTAILLFFLISIYGFSQNRTISGRIIYDNNQTITSLLSGGGTRALCIDSMTNTNPGDSIQIYTTTGGGGPGFISGTNAYGDLAKADKFNSGIADSIKGALLWFGVAVDGGTDPAVPFNVWDATGANGSPGSVLGSANVALSTIAMDVDSGWITAVTFNPAIYIGTNTDFFLGHDIPQNPGDSIALFTNQDPQTDPATAWDYWLTLLWYAYDDASNWDLALAHYMWALMSVNIAANADFTPTVVGKTVTFANTSTGASGYLWDFGDATTNTIASPAHNYVAVGTYTVTLIVFNPCGNDTIMQDVTAVTGIHELNQLKGEMILYPNPTKGHFTIEYPAAPGENIRLMVYNLLGQEIYSESLRGLKVANGHVISLEDINAGSYIVRLISEEGVIENLVIIQ